MLFQHAINELDHIEDGDFELFAEGQEQQIAGRIKPYKDDREARDGCLVPCSISCTSRKSKWEVEAEKQAERSRGDSFAHAGPFEPAAAH